MLQLFVDPVAPAAVDSTACRDRLNRAAGDVCEELRDFIVAHPALSQRCDTPFWRACTDPAGRHGWRHCCSCGTPSSFSGALLAGPARFVIAPTRRPDPVSDRAEILQV